MKVLCLVDFPIKSGDRWLWNHLQTDDQVEFLSTETVDRYAKWGKLWAYYPAYWHLGLRAISKVRKTHYDLVVAWEGKNGFPYGVLRNIAKQRTPKLIILTFIYRGMITHFPRFARFGLEAVNHVTVTTKFEYDYYSSALSLPKDKLSICPLGWYDIDTSQGNQTERSEDRFILAAGRSYRDYATLARAVEGLDIKVLIIAKPFNLAGLKLPDNIETRDLLPIKDFLDILLQAQFVVAPLQPVPYSVGEINIVQSLSAGKAIIATRTPSSEIYIKHGSNGLLVSPGNADDMRQAILRLWQNPDQVAKMGQAARLSFENEFTFEKFAQRVYNILLKVNNSDKQ
jgi:glycosyltransferase involved in cell wall biosynthesis